MRVTFDESLKRDRVSEKRKVVGKPYGFNLTPI
jgi:hypothetical protein